MIYADKHGKIVQVGPHSYVIENTKTRADLEYLEEKRDELVLDSGVSTATHSDSGFSESTGFYNGRQWNVETEFSATADNGVATVSGTAQSYWHGDDPYYSDPIEATITITSRIKASVENVSAVDIGAPSAYTISEEDVEVTLQDRFPDAHNPSLYHDEGAVTFYAGDGNCFDWVRQDDRFKFEYETGDTEFYGNSVRAEVGHCSDYI